MEFLDIINKLANKEELTVTEKRNEDKAIKKAKSQGIAPTSQFNIEMRDVIKVNGSNFDQGKTYKVVFEFQQDVEQFMNKCVYIDNCKMDVTIPFVSTNNIMWRGETEPNSANPLTFETHRLKPHRICAKVQFSKPFLKADAKNIEEKVKEQIMNAIYSKVFATAFSDEPETEINPKGLFNGVSAETISSYEDLLNFIYEGEQNGLTNTILISPKAKKGINKLSTNFQIIGNDNKMLGNDCICSSLVQDGYFAVVPLNYLALANWEIMGFTVDPYTNAIEQVVNITIDCYFDYALADSTLIKVAKFE